MTLLQRSLSLLVVALCAWMPPDAHAQGGGAYAFVENRGQWPDVVHCAADIPGGKVFVEDHGFTWHLFDLSAIEEAHARPAETPQPGTPRIRGHVYTVEWVGARDASTFDMEGLRPAWYNYFLGQDAAQWAGHCRSFDGVWQRGVYDGIDLHVYSGEFFLKYDLVVHPGADPSDVRMKYRHADRVVLEDGRLRILTGIGEVWEQRPIAWQVIHGTKVPVACEFTLEGGEAGFRFPKGYNKDHELIIDPELIFSTYSGSFANNFGYTATYDSEGYLYSGSSAFGQGYPTTTGAYQTTWAGGDGSFGLAGTDMAISKYDVTGTFMVWSSFLGGANDELPHSLICNAQDELIVYGTTSSPNFPVTPGAYDNVFNGGTAFSPQGVGTDYVNGSDIIVTRFNANGSDLVQSTFIGGAANDGVNTATILKFNYADEFRGEIDIDDDGNIYLASCTFSPDFPVVNAVQGSFGGAQDAVIVKLNADLTDILWSTFLGGTNDDSGYSAAFDDAGGVYVCGGTKSQNFPVTEGVLQDLNAGGSADGWIAHLDAQGNDLLQSTYFGSGAYDQLYFVDTDDENNVHVYGQSAASNSTWVINAGWSEPNSGMVITKLDPELETILWSTVFGSGDGEPNLSPSAFLVDVCGKIYLSGWGGTVNTSSNSATDDTFGMTVTADAEQSTTDGSDFYLLVLEADASDLVYASFFGGAISAEHVDGGTSRFDRKGVMYQSVCAGCQNNDDFPIYPSNAVSPTNNSTGCNNGVFKFDFQLPLTAADFIVPPVACVNQPIVFQNTSTWAQTYEWDFGDGSPGATIPNPVHTYQEEGDYTIMLVVTHPGTCNGTDTLFRTISIVSPENQDLGEVNVCSGDQVIIGPEDPDPLYTYTWTPAVFLSDANDPNPTFTAGSSTEYLLLAEHGGCVDSIQVSVQVVELSLSVPGDTTLCDDVPIVLDAVISPLDASVVWSDEPDLSNVLNDGPSDTDISVLPDVPTTYYVELTVGNCTLTEEVFVNLVSFQTQVEGDFTACVGDTVELSVLDPNPAFAYSWAPEELVIEGQDTPTVSVIVEEETTFYVYSQTPDGCTAEDSVIVTVSDLEGEAITATADPSIIVEGQSSQLLVVPGGYDYSWTPSGTLAGANTQDPVATPPVTTTYTVTISDGECSVDATVTVRVVDFVCGPPSIYVPNAFTPNADDRNEKLFVRANNITSLDFQIYDRWGEKVFECDSLEEGWDGTFRGKAVDPAVYVYYLEAVCEGGQVYTEKGNITVIR